MVNAIGAQSMMASGRNVVLVVGLWECGSCGLFLPRGPEWLKPFFRRVEVVGLLKYVSIETVRITTRRQLR